MPSQPDPLRVDLRSPDAFENLVRSERASVERLVRRLLAFPEEFDDVVQEVFVRAWEKAPRYRGDAPAGVWLRGIALRVARSANRNPFRRRRLEVAHEPLGETESSGPDGELVDALQRSLAKLSHAHREVLVLRYLEGLEVEAIAEACSTSRATIDMRLSRARAACRKHMGESR